MATSDIVRAGVSGAGCRNAARHVESLLGQPGPKPFALLICGFAGSLGTADIGDVVVVNRVLDCTGPESAATKYPADSRLVATAESICLPGLKRRTGTLATTNRVLINHSEKTEFMNRFDICAEIVDMETAGAVRQAMKHGIPWLAVRTVTDRFDETMPLDFNKLADGDGTVVIGRVVVAVLTHPGKIIALMRFGRQSSAAASQLTRFLSALLPAISISA